MLQQDTAFPIMQQSMQIASMLQQTAFTILKQSMRTILLSTQILLSILVAATEMEILAQIH